MPIFSQYSPKIVNVGLNSRKMNRLLGLDYIYRDF